MPTVVLKLFARQGTGQTDGQSSDYMLPLLGSITVITFLVLDFYPVEIASLQLTLEILVILAKTLTLLLVNFGFGIWEVEGWSEVLTSSWQWIYRRMIQILGWQTGNVWKVWASPKCRLMAQQMKQIYK